MKNSKLIQRLLIIAGIIIGVGILVLISLMGYKKNDVPKVGLILTGSTADEGWNGVHYQGVLAACEELGAELIVKENVPEQKENCDKAILQLVEEGAEMIILSSYAYPTLMRDTIGQYPEVAFYGISAEYLEDNLTSYFGRMYQARYLAGVLAGLKTENGQVGYVAAMPNSEVNRGINAFALGVRSVRADATVNVIWTYSWDNQKLEEQATATLIEEVGVDVITCHQNQSYVSAYADSRGVYSIGYNEPVAGLSEKHLTAAVWNWDRLYYEIVREFKQGNANSVKSHWFGLDTGVVALADYSSEVTEEEKQKVEAAKERILAGQDVFSGVIYDNNGELRCDTGESVSDEVLLKKMTWFVDGVKLYE